MLQSSPSASGSWQVSSLRRHQWLAHWSSDSSSHVEPVGYIPYSAHTPALALVFAHDNSSLLSQRTSLSVSQASPAAAYGTHFCALVPALAQYAVGPHS